MIQNNVNVFVKVERLTLNFATSLKTFTLKLSCILLSTCVVFMMFKNFQHRMIRNSKNSRESMVSSPNVLDSLDFNQDVPTSQS